MSTSKKWAIHATSLPPHISSKALDPIGYSNVNAVSHHEVNDKKSQNRDKLLYESAMALGKSPGGKLFMTAFMLYMAGSSLQIFSIMMLGMSTWTPISAILNINSAFSRFSEAKINLFIPKLLFIVLNLAGLSMCIYKAQTMGLVPSLSDLYPDPVKRVFTEVSGGTWH